VGVYGQTKVGMVMSSKERLTLELNARLIAIIGVMIAIVFVTTFSVRVPMIAGYVHLGDAAIYMAAFLFGPLVGALAGAFGTGLADLATGTYANYAPGSFVIHGAQGLVAGWLAWRGDIKRMILAVIIGGVILIGGYFIYDLAILRIGWGAATGGLGFNLGQAISGGVLSIPLVLAIRAAYPPILTWAYQRTWQEEDESRVEAD
jgi:uncharacterized membrane protein